MAESPSDLVDVSIDTLLGDHYEFPAVRRIELEQVTQNAWRQLEDNLMFLNASRAWLAVPWRIVVAISKRERTGNPDELWSFAWTRKSPIEKEPH